MYQGRAQTVATGLGYFSIALGVAGLIAPRLLAQASGTPASASMVRACAFREIVSGIGILRSQRRAPWIWARVAGDALDIAMTRRPAALVALAGVTAIDVATAVKLTGEEKEPPQPLIDYSDLRLSAPAGRNARGR